MVWSQFEHRSAFLTPKNLVYSMGTEMRRYVIPVSQLLNFETLLGSTRNLASWSLFFSFAPYRWESDTFYHIIGRRLSSFHPFKIHTNISSSVPQK